MKIVVGSTSAVKMKAVQDAFAQLGIEVEIQGVKANSGIDEQPIGQDVTLKGAEQRAAHAAELDPSGDIYVAIENGIFLEEPDYVDRAIVLLRRSLKTRTIFSEGVRVPTRFVEQAINSGLTKTAGKFMAEAGYVSQHDDPHKDLELVEQPDVKKPRADILKESLVEALKLYREELGL